MSPQTKLPSQDTEAAAAGWRARLHAAWRKAEQTANLAIGVPDYETYVRHQRTQHPDQPVMSYPVFFRSRQDARYGKGTSRCC
jgi:uncharacterized short protein YbdD (DUF466 family)